MINNHWFPGPTPANSHLYKPVNDDETVNPINFNHSHNIHTESENIPLTSTIDDNNDGDDNNDNPNDHYNNGKEDYHFYLDITRIENIGIMISYFAVGFALYFAPTPLEYYLIDSKDASSAQTGVFSVAQSFPWSFKVFYGLLSDSVPIYSYRRKPYFFIGWILYTLLNVILGFFSSPGINTVIIVSFLMSCSLLLADVATDALSVERSKLEPDSRKGFLQTRGYICRACGMVVGAVLGAVVYNEDDWGWGMSINQILFFNGLFPGLLILFFGIPLVELSFHHHHHHHDGNNSNNNEDMIIPSDRFYDKLNDVWIILQSRAVWQPMTFIYIFSVMQIPNSAWYNFLVEGLDFSEFELGLLTISTAIMTLLGLYAYGTCFFNTNFQYIYIATAVLGVFFSFLQLLLIYQVNQKMGIPDVVFALGDNTFMQAVMAIQYMPMCILFIVLCPAGSEGTTYALLTSYSNLASTVATDFGSWMTSIWDTSNDTLEAGDYQGVANLTILTSCCQLLPIVLVFLLPASREEQIALKKKGESSVTNGVILLVVFVASLLFTIVINVYILVEAS